MNLRFLQLFDAEVLDVRLGPSDDTRKVQETKRQAGPTRWKSFEFSYLYAIIFAICVPLMFGTVFNASRSSHPNYELYADKLSAGWILGRKVDNSDLQYSAFRDNLPYLMLVMIGQLITRYIAFDTMGLTLKNRINYDFFFSTIFLLILHGISFFKILLILFINYCISNLSNPRLAYSLTWIFGIGVLFANEFTTGYQFSWINDQLAWLDDYSGIIARWDVHFNFSMLRMISYNIDYLQAKKRSENEKFPDILSENSERQRIDTPRPLKEYNFVSYLAYITYSPLYIAGPILTFNDFMVQKQRPLASINQDRISKYALRFLFCLLTMEFLLHFTYVVAISEARAWHGDSPFQISMIALFNLNIIWLKLLIPWRFFRLWALIDGIDAPENMVRCVDNNYSTLSFWRSWHRSYNRWIIRYIYIPLGGSSRAIVNSLIVFSFVAFWHDIQLRLLLWGWLIVLFVLPEAACTFLFPAKKWAYSPIYRHMCAIGGIGNIWMMMIANLIGFCVGPDGMKEMLASMFATVDGLKYVILSTMALFVGVQVMFEFREREKRKGIDLRC